MNAVPVLLYHSVTDRPVPAMQRFTTSPTVFRGHLDAIRRSGRSAVTIGELARCIRSGVWPTRPLVAITFDDGFADTVEVAAPMLADAGLAATLYVTTGTIGRTSDWLGPDGAAAMATAAQLRDLSAGAWEIGSHGVIHRRLDERAARAVRLDAMASRSTLEDMLGSPVSSFAYPHGANDKTVRAQIVAAGYTSACAVRNALCPLVADVFRIARVTVECDLDAEGVAAVLDGSGIPVAGPRDRARTVAWRAVRRFRSLPQAGRA
jgi:peptidoglycan/xylan/chitin deacetylase (PgdA/CDA1 family)